MIWNGSQPTGEEYVHHVEAYMILYAMIMILRWCSLLAQKEATYCTRVYVQSDHWTGSILNFSTCDLVYLHRFLWGYLVIFNISTQAEVVSYSTRNATIVCGMSWHILGSCICFQDTKIRYNCKPYLTSAINPSEMVLCPVLWGINYHIFMPVMLDEISNSIVDTCLKFVYVYQK